MISSEMIQVLMDAGLTKQQALSVTAETCVKLFMDDDGKLMIDETQRQLNKVIIDVNSELAKMRKQYYHADTQYQELLCQIREVSDTVSAISESVEEYGKVDSERVREALVVYSSVLKMNSKTDASGNNAVRAASYVTWAFLGGEARQNLIFENGADEANSKKFIL